MLKVTRQVARWQAQTPRLLALIFATTPMEVPKHILHLPLEHCLDDTGFFPVISFTRPRPFLVLSGYKVIALLFRSKQIS